MNLKFTYQYDQLGKTAESNIDEHIKGMIEQVLFTAPGERPLAIAISSIEI